MALSVGINLLQFSYLPISTPATTAPTRFIRILAAAAEAEALPHPTNDNLNQDRFPLLLFLLTTTYPVVRMF